MYKLYLRINLIIFVLFLSRSFAQIIVIAHRGNHEAATENSYASLIKAIETGVDYIETDVHQTRDSVVVLMHDRSVNRTCRIPDELVKQKRGRKRMIRDLSFAEFQKLTFKNSDGHPPSLDSALKLINGRCKLLIEIKRGSDYYPGIEKNVIDIIKKNNAESWVNIIHSFDKKALLEVNRQNTGIKLQKLIVFKFPLSSFNFSKQLNKDKFENWQGVNVYYRFITKRLIRKLHAQNKTIYAWTVNKKRPARRLIKKGVDGIITNQPEMIKKEIIANK
jgi:glycerophosphoryl diester phosphodiesterase